jgi:hypothetical protein
MYTMFTRETPRAVKMLEGYTCSAVENFKITGQGYAWGSAKGLWMKPKSEMS